MPFKMTGKSPLTKALLGKQGKLPENLKAAIKAAPSKMVSPLKEITEADKTAARKSLTLTPSQAAAQRIAKGATERTKKLTGAATANQNAGQTFQDLQKKVAGVSQAKKDQIKKNQNQMSGKKKVTPPKVTPPKAKSEVKKQDGSKVQRSQAEKDFLKQQEADRKAKDAVEPKKSDFTKSQFGKKVVNRGSSFTDEYGNTFERSVKGRKKADGSVSKTISNKTNDVTTREKDVTKGPKVKGKRKAKTVTKTKFDSKGNVRKIVTKTRGQKRKVLSDSDAKKKTEELKKRREARDNSPTKMAKSPAKNYKKGYYK
jgi:hypothetical protein